MVDEELPHMANLATPRVGAPVAAALALLVAAAGCARGPDGEPGGLGIGVGFASAAPGSIEEFNATIGDRVFFETDSAELTAQARQTLDSQAQWLNQYTRLRLTVEGHADERGTREYNIALGARRATAVRDYLVALGVGAARIRTISFGKERPVSLCNDISCWSQNRRAVSIIDTAGA
jgi:peptidoglycan-associated lipoprotein